MGQGFQTIFEINEEPRYSCTYHSDNLYRGSCMSDPGGGRDTQISHPSVTDPQKSADLALADLSPRDKPWDKHRHNADRIEAHYRGSEFDNYAQRVHFCSELLLVWFIA
jgi:hypothetical protein